MAVAGVAAAIIAGGKASRFGGQVKSQLVIEGAPIIDRQLAALRPLFDDLVIAANHPDRFAATGLPVVADRYRDRGPKGGLEAVLARCQRQFLFVVAGDMPFLDRPGLEMILAGRGDEVDIVAPFTDGLPQPLCALYARRCHQVVVSQLEAGDNRMSGLFRSRLRVVEIDGSALSRASPRFLRNINSPIDLP